MPVLKEYVKLEIKTGPQGSILSDGRLKWRESGVLWKNEKNNETLHETFIIEAGDQCGHKETFRKDGKFSSPFLTLIGRDSWMLLEWGGAESAHTF